MCISLDDVRGFIMKQTIKVRAASVALVALALALPTLAAAQTSEAKVEPKSDPVALRLSTGLSYSRGDYGDERDTEVVSAPIGLKLTKGPLSIRVSVPYVRISGPGSLIQTPEGRDAGSGGSSSGSSNSGSGSNNSGSGGSGSGSSGSGGSGSGGSGSGGSGSGGSGANGNVGPVTAFVPSSRRSGFGDVNVALTYSFDFGAGFFADASGKVKLPTASTAKRLGTGKTDATVGLDLIKDIGNASVYVGGRRRFAGKPAGSAIRDVWGAGAGASLRASKFLSVGLDYDWQQAVFAGSGSSSEITGWASVRVARTVHLQVYGGTGFTTNSADILGGLSLSWRFK
jgi:hypothetical protein